MFPKYPLAFLPTPLHFLPNLSQKVPYQVYIKRDDQTGLASGGNKTRKLEFLIQEAINLGFDTIITPGAQQSNHCRQTAAACNKAGLECHLLLNGVEPENFQGNLLLDKILGAHLHFSGEKNKGRCQALENLKQKLINQGKKPYIVPVGGSNLTGALGYVSAVAELKQQMKALNLDFDYIFFASSSGGTQAGLMIGQYLYNLGGKLMPVMIDKEEEMQVPLNQKIFDIIMAFNHQSQHKIDLLIEDIPLIKGYNSSGYGTVTTHEKEAIKVMAHEEGILLDPVYTGRAFYGMWDMLTRHLLPENSRVLFWHTGGLPALFAYHKELKNI